MALQFANCQFGLLGDLCVCNNSELAYLFSWGLPQQLHTRDSPRDCLQVLEENVEALGEGSTVVGAALAPVALAEKGSTVNFVGDKDQYWGFRVLPDEKLEPGMTVHKVPTKSLADVKVWFQ